MDRITLKGWRLMREKTIDEMAAVCGVHPNTYRAWEKNPERVPVASAKKISDALGESIVTIFFGDYTTK